MKNSIGLPVNYIIAMSIVKDYVNCIIVKKIIVIMQDNRGKIRLVQKVDINEAKRLKTGKSIFLIFLQ